MFTPTGNTMTLGVRSGRRRRAPDRGQRMANSLARAIPAADRRRQLDRGTRLGGTARRAWPGPGQHEYVLTPQEAMAPDTTGGPALRREFSERSEEHTSELQSPVH